MGEVDSLDRDSERRRTTLATRQRALRVDPIAEANRQWGEHGWGDSALGMALVTSVMRVHQLLLARIEEELKPFELSFARFEVLRLLAFTKEGKMPMASVISRLQVHPASVTSLVDRLSKAGLVNREPHPGDGRATLLILTAPGRAVVESATTVLNERVFGALEIPDDEAKSLVAIMARMRKAAGDFKDPEEYPEALDLR